MKYTEPATDLKSSMDRFIEPKQQVLCLIHQKDLKSSMDRFIEKKKSKYTFSFLYLKSSMDRFIAL